MKCSFCDRAVYSHKPQPICNMHYQRWKRYGRFDAPYREKWYKPRMNRNGYLSIYNGYGKPCILIHRKVMEEYLGRKLSETEIVHHINENRLDNRIENLQIMTRSQHVTHHKRLIDWSKYDVPAPIPRKGNHNLYKNETCLVEGCGKQAKTRKLCSSHYSSYWKITVKGSSS